MIIELKLSLHFFGDKITNAVFLAYTDTSKKWTVLIRNCAFIKLNLSVIFNKRFINSLKL